jgi:hypothetical protein
MITGRRSRTTMMNESVYKTLRIFQEMEKDATPQEKLNWRFQQGLYRAYYDAYIKRRIRKLESEEKRLGAIAKIVN